MKLNELFKVVEPWEIAYLCRVRDNGQEEEIGDFEMTPDGDIKRYAQAQVVILNTTNTSELSIKIKEEK